MKQFLPIRSINVHLFKAIVMKGGIEYLFIPKLESILKANSLDLYVNPQNLTLFDKLCRLVSEENKLFNLTSVDDPNKMALLHIADSLTGAEFIPPSAKVIDIGTGAGFPALPLAIARPDISMTCVDATAKKIAFVQKAADTLGLSNVTCLAGRAEILSKPPTAFAKSNTNSKRSLISPSSKTNSKRSVISHDNNTNSKNSDTFPKPEIISSLESKGSYREIYDVAISRAVANLRLLAELCLPFVKNDGLFLAYKGEKAEEECDVSGNAFRVLGNCDFRKEEFILSYDGVFYGRNIIAVRKKDPIDKKYPRSFAQITKKPL